ncbi:MAG: hypothetical protein JSV96_03800 [Candidatus Aminicenantes bacterium]|nr:MAG: hypothetical protein JSV96_03800 [Candidatus Aminicenantes bacterium]
MIDFEKIYDFLDRDISPNINFSKVIRIFRGDVKQFFILVKHFYFRLFLNDIVSFEEQMKEKVIGILALLAIFSAHLSHVILWKYWLVADKGISWVDKCYLISFFMIVMGFITVLEWDVIFPDSRDFSNLMPLPIKLRTLFSAKFTSLCLFVGLFALGMNSLSTLVFWYYLPQWHSTSLIYGLRFIFAHLTSVFAANFFIFFVSVFLIGSLMTLFGYKIFSRISIYLRAVLMIVFVFLLFLFITAPTYVSQFFSSFIALKESNSLFLYLFPPMWFVGLYETLLGNRDPLFSALSNYSLLAIITPAIAFFIAAFFGYRRYLKKIHEVRAKSVRLFKIKTTLIGIFDSIFLSNPVQRAVFYFFGRTIRRSIFHKMRLITYMAISSGMVLILLTTLIDDYNNFFLINRTLLSVPLILTFFLLVGMRSIVNIPVSLEANWIFRLTQRRDKRHYFSGLKKGVFFYTLNPLFAVLFVIYLFLWGGETAFLHCLYGLVVSVFLMEVLFQNYHKIPFACSYLPGKAKMHIFWIVYLFSFLTFVLFFSSTERKLLLAPSRFLIFYGIIFSLFLLLRIYQNYFLYKRYEIMYEEKLEPAMVTIVPYD